MLEVLEYGIKCSCWSLGYQEASFTGIWLAFSGVEQRRDFDPLFFDEGSKGEEGWRNFGEDYKKEFAPKKTGGYQTLGSLFHREGMWIELWTLTCSPPFFSEYETNSAVSGRNIQ